MNPIQHLKITAAALAVVLAYGCATSPGAGQANNLSPIDWPGATLAGAPQATIANGEITLANRLLAATWSVKDNRFAMAEFSDRTAKQTTRFAEIPAFFLKTDKPETIEASQFRVVGTPELIELKANPQGIRLADRIPGVAVRLSLHHPAGLTIRWTAELRENANYVRQSFDMALDPGAAPITVTEIAFANLPTPHAPQNSLGTVPGSPYAIPGTALLAGLEQPGYLAVPSGAASTALSMPTLLPMASGDHYEIGSVIGVFPAEQRRRSFAYYLERERASPSRAYLHYNVWYDLGFNITDKTLSTVAEAFGRELTRKRGIALDGFVIDDGWDDPDAGFWTPRANSFPQGWSVLQAKARQECQAALGLWISPMGGYGGHDERLKMAKQLGALPESAKNFDLGYPGYYKLYGDTCRQACRTYGVNYFKWDNAAPYENSGRTFGNLKSTAHFMRLCQLARDLRTDKPDLFINATVGTWPSPFWLNHVDSTWRMGGADVAWVGKGDQREKGMNYRDGEVYLMVVQRAPLYPLNSMMFHGVVLGHCFQAKKTSEAGNNMTSEFRSYFALGVNLQELYLSHDLMSQKNWDDLAEAIRWNQRRAAILVDAHWVQGNPMKGEPYAVAAWRRNQGTLMLRNPSDQPQTIAFDPASAFELPTNAARRYQLASPYPDQRVKTASCQAGTPFSITLQPFEVLVFDAEGR